MLHVFTGTDGYLPVGGLIMDSRGVLYGTTYLGGGYGGGTVYRLTPPTSNKTTWTESVLHSFTVSDGALYSTTAEGGINSSCCGTVFKITPPTAGETAATKVVLHAFTLADGASPPGGLTNDAHGNLYGTTLGGGFSRCRCGTVYKLTPGKAAWSESVVHSFTHTRADGSTPAGTLLNANGNLYGATFGTGNLPCDPNLGDCGTVFKSDHNSLAKS